MKVLRLSALRNDRLYLLFMLEADLTPWPRIMSPVGIEPATCLFVAECLNQLRYRVPPLYCRQYRTHNYEWALNQLPSTERMLNYKYVL